MQQIMSDPNAAAEDRRWVAGYSYICNAGLVS
jgi:hypothetical protein